MKHFVVLLLWLDIKLSLLVEGIFYRPGRTTVVYGYIGLPLWWMPSAGFYHFDAWPIANLEGEDRFIFGWYKYRFVFARRLPLKE
jgi:hypothetical protein